jgi:dihydrofolate reductase
MRKVVLSMLVSLDGLTARRDGNLDWFLNDAEFESYSLDMLRNVGAILVGRVTYQMFSEFWPNVGTDRAQAPPGEAFATAEGEREMAGLMNSTPKVVFSRTLSTAPWGPATIIGDDIAGHVSALKRKPGKDLFLFAGATLAQSFMQLDLIDEYRLLIHPIVLGDGIALFRNGGSERALVRQQVKTFRSGIVAVHYERQRPA